MKSKEEALAAKNATESRMQELQERLRRQGDELEEVRQDVLRKKLKVGKLELARKK